jgi:CBS domain-containing protein/anti-sigma regulatory factor (Ser/Thr protein kinase)
VDKLLKFNGFKVKNFMTQEVMVINQNRKVKEAKEIMRIKKISGLPVIDDGKRLSGLISVSDIITVLETYGVQGMEQKIKDVMTNKVITLKPDDNLSHAIYCFRKYGFGRFPIVDGEGKVIGILTKKDIVLGLGKELGMLEPLEGNAAEPGLSPSTINLSYHITGGDFNTAGEASSNIKKKLKQIGIDSGVVRRVAIATYEAEMNIVIHAYRGIIAVKIAPGFVEIIAKDEGPGIEDIKLAMQEGYSTAPDKVRELGFGAGMGLPNMKKCSDEFYIDSTVGEGTEVRMVVYY